jgi:formylglycine-generating enzyme required for sulfatase activity
MVGGVSLPMQHPARTSKRPYLLARSGSIALGAVLGVGCNEIFDITEPTPREPRVAMASAGGGGSTGDGESGGSGGSGGLGGARSGEVIGPVVFMPSGGGSVSVPQAATDDGDAGPDAFVAPAPTPRGPCEAEGLRGPSLVEIPAGSLTIGALDLDNAQPLTPVTFEVFCMDRTEVTTADYAQCVTNGACAAPDTTVSTDCNFGIAERALHPINCVDSTRAEAYCRWAGKRLPTEKEWEYAARGTQARLYPWGNEAPNAALLNWNLTESSTTAVGSYLAGATPDTGLLDLSGNVWEWTASPWCESYAADALCGDGDNVARGGGWASTQANFVRASWRDPDSNGDDRFGFRCAFGDGGEP